MTFSIEVLMGGRREGAVHTAGGVQLERRYEARRNTSRGHACETHDDRHTMPRTLLRYGAIYTARSCSTVCVLQHTVCVCHMARATTRAYSGW